MSKPGRSKNPDIGDFKQKSPSLSRLVKPGDRLKAEDSIITLESDKATMDVPSPSAGTVKDVKVKVGDMVAQGTVVLLLEAAVTAATPPRAHPRRCLIQAVRTPALMTGRASEASRASVMMATPEPATRAAGVSLSGPPPKPGQGEAVNAPPPVVLMPGPAEIVAAVVGGPRSHASPSVRGYARELGVDVSKVKGQRSQEPHPERGHSGVRKGRS